MSVEKLRLTCLVWPDDKPDEHMVEVELDNNRTVMALKKLIKDKHAPSLAHVDACDLVLWKCSIPADDNLQKTLETTRFDVSDARLDRLPPASKISKHFTTNLPDETIHILVEVPAPENEALLASLPHLLKHRQQFNAELPVPSSLGDPKKFSKIQETDAQIVWSRPPDADATIPVTLYHPIFRQFVGDCKNHQPTDKDNKLVRELTAAMSKFFPSEDVRAAELRDILQDNGIPAIITTISVEDNFFCTDGAIESNHHLTVIIDVKEEIGSKGAEPYAQAILYYAHSDWEKSEEYLTFNFPCLIITVFGPQISFSGAVWRARPHFQVLTHTMPLFCHHTDTDMRETLARHFGALKKAIWSLEQCYDALTNPALLENLDPQFPDHRTYCCLETKITVNFKYLHQIDEKKLLFIGETDNRERICIKFVRRYSQAVHEKCAEMGIAPKLRGFEDIGAGWKMVIMDALDEEYKSFDKSILPADTRRQIEERLVELHQANFVHGDVRDANIMVRKDGKPGFMFIDFDWSGTIGEVCYPINVNKVDLWRPDDVSDGLLIKSDHDMAMLDHIFY
ncbi:hypothetical protein AN958_05902 [Leucoagaricus sp. SymC.cos]|nr:hypothetical protein AN958_05902 [Leucoagaricus sp. SymC.cos]